MFDVPFSFDYINYETSRANPNTVHCRNTGLSRFFERYLLQKAMSPFKFTLPESWAENYFSYVLYCFGFIAVLNTDRFGAIPQACGLRGYNVMYQPTHAVVTNPLFKKTYDLRIGTQCEIVRLQPDYGSVLDMVTYYADMLALCAEAAGVNLVNSKMSYVFAADGKNTAESLKKLYDKIASGEPAAVVDKTLFNPDGSPRWQYFSQNVSQNYIVDKLLVDMRKIENMFCTAVGIPNSNTDKKERMITDEVNSNNIETHSLVSVWFDSVDKSFEKINKMFGLNLKVEWRDSNDFINNGIDTVRQHNIRRTTPVSS